MKINFLDRILFHKRQEVAAHRNVLREQDLQHMLRGVAPPLSLAAAIQAAKGLAVIAEMKKASPSQGIIREDYQPEKIAHAYMQAGADAVSVLTDEDYFAGSISHIHKIRPEVQVPILRKDFIIDHYQVQEARAFGADAVLLIVAALGRDRLQSLLDASHELGMQAIVEVHNEQEMNLALQAGAKIVGINNRDLETFEVDLAVTEQLAPLAGAGTLLVAESGIRGAEDLQRMANTGVDAVLVGSHFMRQEDPGAALREFKKVKLDDSGKNLRHQAA